MSNARAHRALARRAFAPGARGPAERTVAWLYLGPVGHFYGIVADVIELGGRYAIARRLGRAPR